MDRGRGGGTLVRGDGRDRQVARGLGSSELSDMRLRPEETGAGSRAARLTGHRFARKEPSDK
jgi:hypothetical protein